MDTPAPQVAPPDDMAPPRFVAGSTMRHVLVMTATGAAGLIAIFVVDLVSLLYISWLGDPRLTAGVGHRHHRAVSHVSINVGLMIPIGALVSRALGARDRQRARSLRFPAGPDGCGGDVVSLVLLPFLPQLLTCSVRRGELSGRQGVPVDRAADQRRDGRRHGPVGRPAGGRRCAAQHVRYIVDRYRHGAARSAC